MIDELYQEIILSHNDNPIGNVSLDLGSELEAIKKKNPHADCAISNQFNPTCGDEIELLARWNGSKLDSIQWNGQGCAISKASASIMTELTVGKQKKEIEELYRLFVELMNSRGGGIGEKKEDKLEDASIFVGVSKYPARIKCALLSWEALRDTYTSN